MSEHKKGLSVDVLVGDLAGDHRVEAREGGHQVREADRAQVLEVFPVQMGQLLRQEVGVLCRGKRKLAGCLRGFPYMTSAEKGGGGNTANLRKNSTVWGGNLWERFCYMFSVISPCLLGQHGSCSTAVQPNSL